MKAGCYFVTVCAIAAMWAASTGCMSGTESLAADVRPEGWRESVELRYVNTDTLTVRELQLTFRHSSAHESPGGRYILRTASPSGAVTRDTLRVRVFLKAQGNKLEEAWTPPTNVRFTETGEYVFTVTPMQNTVGVWSVGMDISKTRRDGQR